MHFSTKFVAVVAATLMPLLASAIQLTSQLNSITSGQQLTLTWNGDNTPVQINLQNGNPGSGSNVANLGNSVSGTSSSITIPNVPSGTYTIQLIQSGQTTYSNQFQITGNGQGPAVNNNNNGYINGQPCENCENNGYGGEIETYISTFISVWGTTTSTYTTTTTGPCTTNGYNGYATTSCFPGVTQVINGITYTSSCTTYGYNPTTTCTNGVTSVINGVTYQPTCTNGVEVINGVTQINDGQIQAAATTPIFNQGTATTLPLTGTFTAATGTATGVQSFFGAAPKVPLSAGAAVLAGGLAALILL